MKRALLLAIALPFIFASASAAPQYDLGDKVAVAPLNDPELLKAEAEARRTLPIFWRLMAANPKNADAFSVKAGFPGRNGVVDFMWLIRIRRHGGKVTGVLDSTPDARPDLHLGQTVTVDERDIDDWTIAMDGRQYGHYTTRVFAKRDPKAAAELKSILSTDPLPAAKSGKDR